MIKILVAGDIHLGSMLSTPRQNIRRELICSKLREHINQADFFIANLESPMTDNNVPIRKSGPNIKTPSKFREELSKLDLSCVSLANNHIMDYGSIGLDDTINECNSLGIKHVGAGETISEARECISLSNEEFSIAILSACEYEFSIATDSTPGANPIEHCELHKLIRGVKNKHDFVLVLLHGGREGHELPTNCTRELCYKLASYGANAIIMSHSHVPCVYEYLHDTFVSYGAGNFIFFKPETKSTNWHVGYMIEISISKDGNTNYQLIPYKHNIKDVRIEMLNGNERESVLNSASKLLNTKDKREYISSNWEQIVEHRQKQYLNMLFGLNRIERLLLKIGILPRWKISDKKMLRIMNILRCETHRECAIDAIEYSLKMGLYKKD